MKQKTEHPIENILGIIALVLFVISVCLSLGLMLIQVESVGMFILLTIGFIKLKELAVDKCSKPTALILKGVLNTIFVGVSISFSIKLMTILSAFYMGSMIGNILGGISIW